MQVNHEDFLISVGYLGVILKTNGNDRSVRSYLRHQMAQRSYFSLIIYSISAPSGGLFSIYNPILVSAEYPDGILKTIGSDRSRSYYQRRVSGREDIIVWFYFIRFFITLYSI